MTTSRGFSTATLLPEGKVLIAGEGFPGPPITPAGVYVGSADLYDPVTGTFSTRGDLVTQSREGHGATLLPDGKVLMSGGWVCCGYSIATAEIYHPAVLAPSPALFSLSGDGRGQGAIWHAASGQLASPGAAAFAGEVLAMYTTGLLDGGVIPPQVSIGGRLAQILFFGNAPGYPGFNQVNFRVPSGVAPGSAVPLRLTYLNRPSNEVTIAVQ
jgi:hypothetical protein